MRCVLFLVCCSLLAGVAGCLFSAGCYVMFEVSCLLVVVLRCALVGVCCCSLFVVCPLSSDCC